MVPRWRLFGDFCVLYFQLGEENKKKKKEETTGQKYNGLPYYIGRP